jgi:foldase protein PrsA
MALTLVACGGPTQGPRPTVGARTASDQRTTLPRSGSESGSSGSLAVAAWRNRTVTWEEIRPALVEIAGATALRDAFLDDAIAQALAERSITIGQEVVDRERRLLAESLDPDPNLAERLLGEIRNRQGLGPVRFEALLRRNAGLRALVQPDVRLTEDAIARQHEVMHGAKRVCRVIAVPSVAQAEEIRRQLEAGASFADLATQRSTDPSGSRGGLLPPVSRVDPTWPQPFRDALFALPIGAISAPTLVDRDYLIIRAEEERSANGLTLASTRPAVEAALRQAQERVLMEELARRLLAEITPSFYESDFGAAWRTSGG